MNVAAQAWLDQEDARVAAAVRKHGWFIEYVGGRSCTAPGCDCAEDGDGPAFAYTVGLFGLHHPELLIFGVPPDVAFGVLNNLGSRVKAGEALLPGQLLTFREWPHQVMPEPVPNPEDIVFGANRYYQLAYGSSVPVLQLSYDDTWGHFPWEDQYAARELQPRPGAFHA
jgi:uncharacterized protein DUF4262